MGMEWVAAAIILISSFLAVGFLGSIAETTMFRTDKGEREMGSLSSVSLDLTGRKVGWADAIAQAETGERGRRAPVEGFTFIDLCDDEDGARKLDYGIAIGYAPRFLSFTTKQVSYVLRSEDVEPTGGSGFKPSGRRRLVAALDAGVGELVQKSSRHSRMEHRMPCIDEEATPFLID